MCWAFSETRSYTQIVMNSQTVIDIYRTYITLPRIIDSAGDKVPGDEGLHICKEN